VNKENMIDFLVDNEPVDDLKDDLKKYFRQVERAKDYLLEWFYDEKENKWKDKHAQQVYYFLEFNNNEVK